MKHGPRQPAKTAQDSRVKIDIGDDGRQIIAHIKQLNPRLSTAAIAGQAFDLGLKMVEKQFAAAKAE